MNSRFRCIACRDYKPADQVHRRLGGLGAVCSDECYQKARQRARKHRTEVRRRLRVEEGPKAKARTDSLSPQAKERIRARDRHRCRRCGTTVGLHVHHINYRSQGGPDEDWNLITLCVDCHALVHSNKRHWQPLCRGYIWMLLVEGRQLTLDQVERRAAA